VNEVLRLFVLGNMPLMVRRMESLFAREANVELLGAAAAPQEAVALCRELRPDVVVVCVQRAEGFHHYLQAVRTIAKELNIHVLVVGRADTLLMVWALRKGASGFVEEESIKREEVLLDAVERVACGQLVLTQAQLKTYMRSYTPMSRRERELITLLGHRLDDDEIAARMGIKPASVRKYVERLRRKLELRNREELCAFARDLIDMSDT